MSLAVPDNHLLKRVFQIQFGKGLRGRIHIGGKICLEHIVNRAFILIDRHIDLPEIIQSILIVLLHLHIGEIHLGEQLFPPLAVCKKAGDDGNQHQKEKIKGSK